MFSDLDPLDDMLESMCLAAPDIMKQRSHSQNVEIELQGSSCIVRYQRSYLLREPLYHLAVDDDPVIGALFYQCLNAFFVVHLVIVDHGVYLLVHKN